MEWDESAAFKRSSAELFAEYRELAKQPGASARQVGDVAKAFGSAARTIEATYEFPFLAHASMEPLNCVVRVGAQDCEVWNGEQFQTVDQAAIAKLLGIPPASVKLNQLYAGGSFGRRANPASDYLVEAVAIAKAAGVSEPVKMVWTREVDMRAGFYRPMYVHTLKAGLDQDGKLVAWQHRIVGQSIMAATTFGGPGLDRTSVEGASNAAVRRSQPVGGTAHDQAGCADSMVAFGGLDPHGILDGMFSRRYRSCHEAGSLRDPSRIALGQAHTSPGSAGAGGEQVGLEQAARQG